MAQILYGAGHNLSFHFQDWIERGINPVCIVDSATEKQHTQFFHSNMEFDILPFSEANARYPGSKWYITLTIPNCYKVREWLTSQGISEKSIYILAEMFVEYPVEDNSDLPFAPEDTVKSCDYIERGISFLVDGLYCCCLSSGNSGILIDSSILNSYEDIQSHELYDLIIKERKQYFLALNGKISRPLGHCNDCIFLCEKPFREVTFSSLGGKSGLQVIDDQSSMICNHKCVYCGGKQYACQYDNRIVLKTIEGFVSKKKPSFFFIAINSGEPSLRKDLDELLDYLMMQQLENVNIYSNASIYSKGIEKSLKNNQVKLITSVDAGTRETYKSVHRADDYSRVINNLISYSVMGNGKHIRIKYIVLDDESNTSDDDLFGFLYAALLIKPEDISILPQFRDISEKVPNSTIEFAAKMFYLCPFITNKTLRFFPALGIGGNTDEFPNMVRERVAALSEDTKTSLAELALRFLQDKTK